MEAFLAIVLPTIMGDLATYTIHTFQGKSDLMNKLEARLRGYAKWLPTNMRVFVLVDRDDDDCIALKAKMEDAANTASLLTRTTSQGSDWRVVNRVVIEELEAWFFGAWTAVRAAYPRVPATIPNQAPYRDCDAISGGTWEALERVFQRAGYFSGGLRKVEAAQTIGSHFLHSACQSTSFSRLREAIIEAISLQADPDADDNGS